jgi:hypothetical protein
VPGNSSIRQCGTEMGNDCSAKTLGAPNLLLTLKPSASIVAVVLVPFQRFPCGLWTRLVLTSLRCQGQGKSMVIVVDKVWVPKNKNYHLKLEISSVSRDYYIPFFCSVISKLNYGEKFIPVSKVFLFRVAQNTKNKILAFIKIGFYLLSHSGLFQIRNTI